MSNSLSLIKQLIQHIEDYDNQIGNADIKEFTLFLRDRVLLDTAVTTNASFDVGNFKNFKDYPEVEFSTLLTGLFRFAKHYVKKAFKNVSFKTLDEFGFLATLLREENLLKNELIQKHLLEISSGSEILKRLIRKELIYQYPDEKDKRAKRVALTEKGKKEIFMAFKDMHQVSEIIIGNLTSTELNEALVVFNKLNYFHQHIHEVDKNASIDLLHDKYVSTS